MTTKVSLLKTQREHKNSEESVFTKDLSSLISKYKSFRFGPGKKSELNYGHPIYFFEHYQSDLHHLKELESSYYRHKKICDNQEARTPRYCDHKKFAEDDRKNHSNLSKQILERKQVGRKKLMEITSSLISLTSTPQNCVEVLATLYNVSDSQFSTKTREAMVNNNETLKSLYTGSLVGLIIDTLIEQGHRFSSPELNSQLLRETNSNGDELAFSLKMTAVMASLTYNIGLASPRVTSFFEEGDVYGPLIVDSKIDSKKKEAYRRKQLVKAIQIESQRYLKKGLSLDPIKANDDLSLDVEQLHHMLEHFNTATDEFGSILKVAMNYSAFLFPKNFNSHNNSSFALKAYDILNNGVDQGFFRADIVGALQSKIGYYPPGSVHLLRDSTYQPPSDDYYMVSDFLLDKDKPKTVKTSRLTSSGTSNILRTPKHSIKTLDHGKSPVKDIRGLFGKSIHPKKIFQ